MKKLDNFSNSLKVLKTVDYDLVRDNDIYRAGVVHQFGLTFDLSWKALQSMLREHGVVEAQTGSTRELLKLGYKHGFIDNEKAWLNMLDMRNAITHEYNEDKVNDLIPRIKEKYISVFSELEKTLTEKLKEIDDVHNDEELDLTMQKNRGL